MGVQPTAAEVAATMPGDDIVPAADVVMDRAFTVPASPEQVWPWLVQLGKGRAGWYLPRRLEWAIPRRRRGLRHLEPRLQGLAVGETIPDWGGTFTLAILQPPTTLVHSSQRGRTLLSWAIRLASDPAGTRVHLRLRLGPVRRKRLAQLAGGVLDWATTAGLAAGLRERVRPPVTR